MKKIACLLFLFGYFSACAQKKIESLINAEKDFASYSVAHGTKDAFLKYLDSSSVIFEKGKPVNGLEAWNKRDKVQGILNWYPLYAEIASSGDLGFTSGPWTFQPKSINDSIVARGNFNSVWRLDNNGEWKNIVDIGVNKTPQNPDKEIKKKELAVSQGVNPDTNDLLINEEQFEKILTSNPKEAYRNFLSHQSILNRNGMLPANNINDQIPVIATTPEGIQFTRNGNGISKGGDVGYVYGTASLNGRDFNYLHVWRKEPEGWKLALEVLPY